VYSTKLVVKRDMLQCENHSTTDPKVKDSYSCIMEYERPGLFCNNFKNRTETDWFDCGYNIPVSNQTMLPDEFTKRYWKV
jgi:hypothetical protein